MHMLLALALMAPLQWRRHLSLICSAEAEVEVEVACKSVSDLSCDIHMSDEVLTDICDTVAIETGLDITMLLELELVPWVISELAAFTHDDRVLLRADKAVDICLTLADLHRKDPSLFSDFIATLMFNVLTKLNMSKSDFNSVMAQLLEFAMDLPGSLSSAEKRKMEAFVSMLEEDKLYGQPEKVEDFMRLLVDDNPNILMHLFELYMISEVTSYKRMDISVIYAGLAAMAFVVTFVSLIIKELLSYQPKKLGTNMKQIEGQKSIVKLF